MELWRLTTAGTRGHPNENNALNAYANADARTIMVSAGGGEDREKSKMHGGKLGRDGMSEIQKIRDGLENGRCRRARPPSTSLLSAGTGTVHAPRNDI
jgi:hypothetical protein